MSETGAERIIIPMSSELLGEVDDYRFRHRLPSRAAAVRVLLRRGLEAETGVGRPFDAAAWRRRLDAMGAADFLAGWERDQPPAPPAPDLDG